MFKDFVVSFLVLLDETFQADVTPGFDPAVVAGQQKQKAVASDRHLAGGRDRPRRPANERGRLESTESAAWILGHPGAFPGIHTPASVLPSNSG